MSGAVNCLVSNFVKENACLGRLKGRGGGDATVSAAAKVLSEALVPADLATGLLKRCGFEQSRKKTLKTVFKTTLLLDSFDNPACILAIDKAAAPTTS